MCGNLQGKTRSEVITLIGPPTTQSIQNNNGQVVTFVTWTRASYTVIARFDAKDRFVAIVNQGKNIQ